MFVVCHTGGNVIFMSSIVFGPLLFLFFTFLGSEWFYVFIMNFLRSCTKCLCLTLIFDSLARVFCLLYMRFDIFPVLFFILICLDLFYVYECLVCMYRCVPHASWCQWWSKDDIRLLGNGNQDIIEQINICRQNTHCKWNSRFFKPVSSPTAFPQTVTINLQSIFVDLPNSAYFTWREICEFLKYHLA